MENMEELEIDVEDIGTILKSSRLKQKKTMEEISSELCIRKIYLTALEEGDYDTLPPIPYGIGYVRTYASYLGLNPERAVRLYKAASIVEDKHESNEQENVETNKSSVKHIVVGILSLVIIYAVWSLYNVSQQYKDISEVSEPEDTLVEETVLIDSSDGSITTEVETLVEETKSTEVIAEPVIEQSKIDDKTTNEKEIKTEEPVVENDVVLEFSGESWVELKGKNKTYIQGVFHKGDKKKISYVNNLFLSVGRPSNVKVIIKGVEKDILAKHRKMNIPLDSLD